MNAVVIAKPTKEF